MIPIPPDRIRGIARQQGLLTNQIMTWMFRRPAGADARLPAERCLTEGLDLLIGQFEAEFPEFVTEYRNERVVAEPGSKPELKIVQPVVTVTPKAA